MQNDEENMDDIEFDILTEIGNIGAGNATTALAKLIDGRVDMHVPRWRCWHLRIWQRSWAEQRSWWPVFY